MLSEEDQRSVDWLRQCEEAIFVEGGAMNREGGMFRRVADRFEALATPAGGTPTDPYDPARLGLPTDADGYAVQLRDGDDWYPVRTLEEAIADHLIEFGGVVAPSDMRDCILIAAQMNGQHGDDYEEIGRVPARIRLVVEPREEGE